MIIHSRNRDLGGFLVHRSLPSPQKRQVGPFVFLDHMGPMTIDERHAMDVRPHPHIGLATVTYLFSGRGLHRDSLGSQQFINPGDLNWMTAGRGIVHSERTPQEDRDASKHIHMHGVQIWIGLPVDQEECEPTFVHWPKEQLPALGLHSAWASKLLLGSYGAIRSPVETKSRTLFIDVQVEKDTRTALSLDEKEIAIFLVAGQLKVDGQELGESDLALIENPGQIKIEASVGARFLVVGGDPFPEPRYIWWNFVSSRKERIREAAEAWRAQKIGSVPGETDFIPLPNDPFPA